MPVLSEEEGGKVKPAGYKQEYTKEQIFEIMKCRKDPIYFIEKYIYIEHPFRGSVPFTLFEYQKNLVKTYCSNNRVIAMLSRQCGKTISAAAYLLWWAIFKNNQQILIASKDQDGAKEIMDRLWFAYEELPWWIKPGTKTDQIHTKVFDNRSRIRATATTKTSGRGKSNSLVYLDEFAFVRPGIANDFWTSIYPTLSCLAGDTLVLTQSGLIPIETFHENRKVGEYFELDGFSTWGLEGMESISHGYVSPESDTLIVKNEHGMEVEATLKHPFYIASSNGGVMRENQDLIEGSDYQRIDVGMNVFGKEKILPDRAYMLGGYTAEGWMTGNNGNKHTIWISNTDNDFKDVYLNSDWIKPFKEGSKKEEKLRCSSMKLIEEFVECGIDPYHKCDKKEIPSIVLRGDKETVCNYLSGLFDGDGSVTDRGINLTSTSKKIVQQVQIVLFNLGIVSRVLDIDNSKRLPRKIGNNVNLTMSYKNAYSLSIPLSQLFLFKEYIGFRIKRKNTKLEQLIEKRSQDDRKQFTIPVDIISTTLRNIISKSNMPVYWFRTKGKIRFDKLLDGKPGRKMTLCSMEELSRLIKQIDLNLWNEYKEFFGTFTKKATWSKIVKKTASTNVTYDFTVPGTHAFLQNGVMGSNTGGKCIITSTPNTDEDKFAKIWFNAEMSPFSDVWNDPYADRSKSPTVERDDYETIFESEDAKQLFQIQDGTVLDKTDDEENTDDFVAFHAHWTKVPDVNGGYRGEKFKRQAIAAGLTFEEWTREFECAFVSGDSTLISGSKLATLRRDIRKPKFVDRWGCRWYEEIRPNVAYGVVLDPSEGIGLDDACIQVWEIPSLRQVAEWNSNYADQTEQTKMIRRVLKRLYHMQQDHPDHMGECNIYYSVERNGLGIGILQTIEYEDESTFPGFLIDSTMTSSHARGAGFGRENQNKWRGLITTVPTKKRYAVEFKNLVEQNLFTVRSKFLASQMKTFVRKGQSFAAKEGAKDDIIMSAVLMVHLIDEIRYHEPDLDDLIRPDLDDYDPNDLDHPDNMAMPPII